MGEIFGKIIIILFLFFLLHLAYKLFMVNWIVGTGFVLIIIALYRWSVKAEEKEKEKSKQKQDIIEKVISDLKSKGFAISQQFISKSKDCFNGIFFDDNSKKISIFDVKDGQINLNIYEGSEILESQIIEDGNIVANVDRIGQIGGALIGGALAGEAGAIVGGLSASSNIEKQVKKIDLKVIVKDVKKPYYIINFMDEAVGKKKDDPVYQDAISKAMYWHSLLKVLMTADQTTQ